MFQDVTPNPVKTQIRGRGGADGRWYAPERDVAYLGPELLRAALRRFDTLPADDPDYAAVLGQIPVNEARDGICAFARQLALAINAAMYSTDRTSLAGVVEKFADPDVHVPAQARIATLAAIGEFFIGAVFAAKQDTSPIGDDPPADRGIQQLVEAADEFYSRVRAGRAVVETPSDGAT